MVANSTFVKDPKLDFVKYAQAFWTMMTVSNFMVENKVNPREHALFLGGDLSSEPRDSAVFMILNRAYSIKYTAAAIYDQKYAK